MDANISTFGVNGERDLSPTCNTGGPQNSERNCLINDWKAPRLWFGDTKDALIGLLGLALATHETPEYGLFGFIRQFLEEVFSETRPVGRQPTERTPTA